MPAREAQPSGMDQATASALRDQIAASGYHAEVKAISSSDYGNAAVDPAHCYVVEAETGMGWETFFSVWQWQGDPTNPDRSHNMADEPR